VCHINVKLVVCVAYSIVTLEGEVNKIQDIVQSCFRMCCIEVKGKLNADFT
jgi:hypothetical protein